MFSGHTTITIRFYWFAVLFFQYYKFVAAAANDCYAADVMSDKMKCQKCSLGDNGYGACADPYETSGEEPTTCFPSLDVCCQYSADGVENGCAMINPGVTPHVTFVDSVNVDYIQDSTSFEIDQPMCATHFAIGGDPQEGNEICRVGTLSLTDCQHRPVSTPGVCTTGTWFFWKANGDGTKGSCWRLSDKYFEDLLKIDFDYPDQSDASTCPIPEMAADFDFCDDPAKGCLVCKGTPRCGVPRGDVLVGPVLGCSTDQLPLEILCEMATTYTTTPAPTTEAPTTEAPTTEAPTTAAPTTEAPTTEAPTTAAPTTAALTTESPTTTGPTAPEPTTPSMLTTSTNTATPSDDGATTTNGDSGIGTTTGSSNDNDNGKTYPSAALIGGVTAGCVALLAGLIYFLAWHYGRPDRYGAKDDDDSEEAHDESPHWV